MKEIVREVNYAKQSSLRMSANKSIVAKECLVTKCRAKVFLYSRRRLSDNKSCVAKACVVTESRAKPSQCEAPTEQSVLVYSR